MDFVKRNLFYIVCALMAIGGIALIVTGVRAMPKVQAELSQVASLHRNLTGIQNSPASLEAIETAQERIAKIQQDWERVRERAKQLYDYELLVAGALPNGDSIKCSEFRNAYTSGMDQLMERLNYGRPASRTDAQYWKERIAAEEADRRELGPNHPLAPPLFTGPPRTRAGVITRAGAQSDPLVRANLAAAQRIQMYALHWAQTSAEDKTPTLDFWPGMEADLGAEAPALWDVWHAQYSYWIQKDIVDAIVTLNDAAAERLREQGEHPWVGNMPVKDLIAVRVSASFVPRDGEWYQPPAPGGYEAELPPVSPENAFTHHGSNELFEVLQFTVKAVMDQRDILRFVDLMSENSMHTLLRLSYRAVPPNRDMLGKIYGDEPAVNVSMVFETVLLGERFRRLMPVSVRDYYGVVCRPVDECDEGGEG